MRCRDEASGASGACLKAAQISRAAESGNRADRATRSALFVTGSGVFRTPASCRRVSRRGRPPHPGASAHARALCPLPRVRQAPRAARFARVAAGVPDGRLPPRRAVIVQFDLPGVEPEAIDLIIEQNVLAVRAERRFEPPATL